MYAHIDVYLNKINSKYVVPATVTAAARNRQKTNDRKRDEKNNKYIKYGRWWEYYRLIDSFVQMQWKRKMHSRWWARIIANALSLKYMLPLRALLSSFLGFWCGRIKNVCIDVRRQRIKMKIFSMDELNAFATDRTFAHTNTQLGRLYCQLSNLAFVRRVYVPFIIPREMMKWEEKKMEETHLLRYGMRLFEFYICFCVRRRRIH